MHRFALCATFGDLRYRLYLLSMQLRTEIQNEVACREINIVAYSYMLDKRLRFIPLPVGDTLFCNYYVLPINLRYERMKRLAIKPFI